LVFPSATPAPSPLTLDLTAGERVVTAEARLRPSSPTDR
jgi:hypothetical protein